MPILGTTQLVLVESELEAVRADHSRQLLFGRTTPRSSQPWFLWHKTKRIEGEEFFAAFSIGAVQSIQGTAPTVPESVLTYTSEVHDYTSGDWSEPWRLPTAPSLFPFRQIATPLSEFTYSVEVFDFSLDEWNDPFKGSPVINLLPFRQIVPTVPVTNRIYTWPIQARLYDEWADLHTNFGEQFEPFRPHQAFIPPEPTGTSNPGGGGGGRTHGDSWSGKFEFNKRKPKRETLTLKRKKTDLVENIVDIAPIIDVKASQELVKALSFNLNDDDEATLAAVLDHERQLILNVLGRLS